MISAAAWIKQGVAARHPQKYAVDDAELARVAKLANIHFDDAKAQLEGARLRMAGDADEVEGNEWEEEESGEEEAESMDEDGEAKMDEDEAPPAAADEDGLAKYNLDTYDDEQQEASSGPFSNIKGLQYYRNNDEDPYITLKDDAEDEALEREELEVLPTDNMVICAKTEDEVSLIECYVYASSDANLYVHHDLMLPSFPLALEWLDYAPAKGGADQNSEATGRKGNYIAVGTMDPEIEIWSMDVMEGLFPDAILGNKEMTKDLGGSSGTGKKKRRIPKARIANDSYHVDAVLGLSWNRVARNLIASASADCTIKLWDLSRPASGEGAGVSALRNFDKIHTDKVQSVAWNTSGGVGQPSVLLSGSYDKTLRVFDTRSPEGGVMARVKADVECVRWNPWREHNFLASFEDGLIQSFDARMLSTPGSKAATQTLFTLAAHDGACTSFDISPHIPGCLATGGSDKVVKLWSIEEEPVESDVSKEAKKPKGISMVTSRDLDAGKVFSANFSPDDPLTLAVAGSNGTLRIWDSLSNVGVRRTFGDRLKAMPADMAAKLTAEEQRTGDGVVMLDDEGSEDSDDEDEEGAPEEEAEAQDGEAEIAPMEE